jgi:MFS family permease
VTAAHDRPLRLGLQANLGQFALLVSVNALVGGMVGQERTVLPLLAGEVFGLRAASAALTFIVVFGLAKAATNLIAGALSDRFGRRPVLIAGWAIGVPVPLLIIWAPEWEWVVLANALLGINQGLTWSTTVIMKIDLVGPARRGLAMGINESAGYLAVAATALATGFIAAEAGLRPAPFLLGLAYAGLGLGASVLFVRETRSHVEHEQRQEHEPGAIPRWREVFGLTTYREPSLAAASQAGLVNNLNDGMAWGLLPLFYAAAGLDVVGIAILGATYLAVWGLCQPAIGALSDRIGRRPVYLMGAVGVGLWMFPFFSLIDTGGFGHLILAVTVGLVLHGAMYAPQAAFFSEMFATRMRYSGASIGAQFASVAAGAPAPLIATALLSDYGSSTPISLYVIGAAVVTIVAVGVAKETRHRDLSDVEPSDDAEPAAAPTADARTA